MDAKGKTPQNMSSLQTISQGEKAQAMTLSLRNRLLKYLLNHHGWIASGELQRIVVLHTDYTPRTAVRRLEELAEEGKLDVKYIKGHAYYSYGSPKVA